MKRQFLQDIIDMVQMEEIPFQLIFNWDQTVSSSLKLDNGRKGIKTC